MLLLVLATLSLSATATAGDEGHAPREPICALVKPQRELEASQAAELRTRIDPISRHPRVHELSPVVRRHLSCLGATSRKLEELCQEISSKETNPINGILPYQEVSRKSTTTPGKPCYHFEEAVEIAQSGLQSSAKVVERLEKLDDAYKKCTEGLPGQLDAWMAKVENPSPELRASAARVNQFPLSVTFTPGLKTEIERRRADLGPLQRNWGEAKLHLTECQQKPQRHLEFKRAPRPR